MKRFGAMWVVGCLALVLPAFPAGSQMIGERGVPIVDDFMQQPVTPPAGAPLNDYLVQLAEAADISIIADATDFEAGATVTAYPGTLAAVAGLENRRYADKWQPNRSNLLADVAAQESLSRLRYDRQTFLLWHEADPLTLAPLLVAAKTQETAQLKATPLKKKQIHDLLKATFMAAGWDGKSVDVDISVKVDDLPADLKNHVLLETRAGLARSSGARGSDVWFNPGFWTKAQFGVQYDTINDDVLYPFLVLRDAAGTEPRTTVGNLYPSLAAKTPPAAGVPIRR